jgi:hypothetical protein
VRTVRKIVVKTVATTTANRIGRCARGGEREPALSLPLERK